MSWRGVTLVLAKNMRCTQLISTIQSLEGKAYLCSNRCFLHPKFYLAVEKFVWFSPPFRFIFESNLKAKACLDVVGFSNQAVLQLIVSTCQSSTSWPFLPHQREVACRPLLRRNAIINYAGEPHTRLASSGIQMIGSVPMPSYLATSLLPRNAAKPAPGWNPISFWRVNLRQERLAFAMQTFSTMLVLP